MSKIIMDGGQMKNSVKVRDEHKHVEINLFLLFITQQTVYSFDAGTDGYKDCTGLLNEYCTHLCC